MHFLFWFLNILHVFTFRFGRCQCLECVWFWFCSCFCASRVVAAYFLICPRKLCSDLMLDGISTVGSLWSHCPYVKCVPPGKTWICFCLDVAIWAGICPLILSISVKIKTGSIPESAFSRPPTEDAIPQSPDFVAPLAWPPSHPTQAPPPVPPKWDPLHSGSYCLTSVNTLEAVAHPTDAGDPGLLSAAE